MKKILLFILFGIVPLGIWAQDSKVSALTATTTVDDDDLFYIIDGGTTSKKITGLSLKAGVLFPVDVRTNAAGQVLFESLWLGEDAGINHTAAAYYNFGVGSRTHYGLTSGLANSALGYNSGFSLTTGSGNDYQGFQSGYTADTSRFSVALGYQSYYGANGYGNIALGYKSAYNLDGKWNLFAGWLSGYTSTTADYSVGLGFRSLYAQTSGDYNTAVGAESLSSLTSAQYAVGIGYQAADSMSASSITAIGGRAGRSTTGANNVLVGFQTGYWLKGGLRNTVVGDNALLGAWGSDGDDNAIFGAYAGNNLGASADQNTHIGAYAGDGQTTASGTVKIGYQAGLNDNTSNTLHIANSSGDTLIYGEFDNDSVVINGDLYVTGDHNLGGIVASDTAAMLANYAELSEALLRADTAAMLSTYAELSEALLRADTAAMLANYTELSEALLRTDTAAMLANYAELSEALLRADTAAMLTTYITRGDTAAMLTNYALTSEVPIGMTDATDTYLGTGAGTGESGGSAVGIGLDAGQNNTSTGSVFMGAYAGDANTSAINTAIGYQALSAEVTGGTNTIVGYQSADIANGITGTTTLGYNSGGALTTGDNNTLVGVNSGDALTTEAGSVIIGAGAGGTGAGNVIIGNNAGANNSASNVLMIDNSNDATPLIAGDFSTDDITINGDLEVTGDAGNLSVLSLTSTGEIGGLTDITLDVTSTVTLTAGDCDNAIRFNNDADIIQYDLPAAAVGLVVMFYDIGPGVISINPAAGDVIYLNGTALDAGDEIDSPGALGDFIVLMAIDATRWVTLGQVGIWIDGGAS